MIENTLANNIKHLHIFIKNKDITNLKKIFKKDPELINFKNKKSNNLLFYCLEKKSYEIFNFILEEKPDLLTEKNNSGFNCFSNLINKEKLLLINSFLLQTKENIILKIGQSEDFEGNTILMQILKKEKPYYEMYCKYFRNLELSNNFLSTNFFGQSVFHIIAMHNSCFAEDILNKKEFKNEFTKKDVRGLTPFLLSSRFSNFDLFMKFYKNSDVYQNSELKSDALHFAAYSNNKEKINFLLEKGFNPEKNNEYMHSPFMISIIEKKYDSCIEMIKYIKIIEPEQFFPIIRLSSKNPELINYIFENKNILSINNFLTDPIKEKIINYIFYYCSMETIVKNKSFICSLMKINEKNCNALFFSSIAGRKDFIKKTDFIIKSFGWYSSEQGYFNNFSKQHPLGYVSSLYQLPKTQFESLIKNNNIIKKITKKDFFTFILICIAKNSLLYEEIITKDYLLSNELQVKESELIFLSNLTEEKILNNLDFLISTVKSSDKAKLILANKLSKYIYEKSDPINTYLELIKKIRDKKLSQQIFIKLNENYLMDHKFNELEIIFNNKNELMLKVFKNILVESPEKIKNKNYILKTDSLVFGFESYMKYLDANFFQKDFFYPKEKIKNLYVDFIKSDLNKYKNLNNDFLSEIIKFSPDKKKVIEKILDFSIHNTGIFDWNSHFKEVKMEKENQKETILKYLNKFIFEKSTNINFWNFLEKKYSILFVNKFDLSNISNLGHEDLLLNKLQKKISYINIFTDALMEKYKKLNLININEFETLISKASENLIDFNKYFFKDFLFWDNNNKNTSSGLLVHLSLCLKLNIEPEYENYCTIVRNLEIFLVNISSVKASENNLNYQNIIDNILFNKEKNVQNLILNSSIIKEFPEKLTYKQNSFIFKDNLEKKLNNIEKVERLNKIIKI